MKSLDLNFKQIDRLIYFLKAGKIGVMPTDTVYGIVGSALNPKTVEEIYQLRKRSSDKPMIILISDIFDLTGFDINISKNQEIFLKHVWPNPVSVILPCQKEKFKYLHRGTNSLAFRIPGNEILIKIMKKVGPLVAPSANYESDLPAETIMDAKRYFGEDISFYLDEGEIKSKPSTIIELGKNGQFKLVREGAFIPISDLPKQLL